MDMEKIDSAPFLAWCKEVEAEIVRLGLMSDVEAKAHVDEDPDYWAEVFHEGETAKDAVEAAFDNS